MAMLRNSQMKPRLSQLTAVKSYCSFICFNSAILRSYIKSAMLLSRNISKRKNSKKSHRVTLMFVLFHSSQIASTFAIIKHSRLCFLSICVGGIARATSWPISFHQAENSNLHCMTRINTEIKYCYAGFFYIRILRKTISSNCSWEWILKNQQAKKEGKEK